MALPRDEWAREFRHELHRLRPEIDPDGNFAWTLASHMYATNLDGDPKEVARRWVKERSKPPHAKPPTKRG